MDLMKYDVLKYKANYYILLLLAFVLPLERKLAPPLIVLFLITSLFYNRFTNIKNYKILLFAALFFIYLIGLSYSDFPEIGFKDIVEKLSLFIFPLTILISNINFKKKLKSILYSFILGCLFSALIGLINSFIGFYNTGDTSLFFYHKVSFFLHPSYYAMYICFSLLILYHIVFTNKLLSKKELLFSYSLILFFSILIILSASKTGLISLLLIHFTAIAIWVIKHKVYWKGLLVFLSLALITFLTYKSSTVLRNRVNEFIDVAKTGNTSKGSTTAARAIIWGLSIDLISEKPLLGYGTGTEKQVLIEKYIEQNHTEFASKKLNTHNQFLQTTIAVGIAGGLILLIILFYPLLISFKNEYYLYSFFLMLILLNLLTESMLERQAGVVFYSMFNALFFMSYFNNNKTMIKS